MGNTLTDKVILAEISDNQLWNRYFSLYAHTWSVNTLNEYDGIINSEFNPYLIGLEVATGVLSFLVNKKQYNKVDTIAEVVANDKSFHFDITTKLLTVHFENNSTPYMYSEEAIEIGFLFGLYKSSRNVIPEWNNQQYYPRLGSTPEIVKQKDDTFFSKQVFPSASIDFDNSDFRFEKFSIGKDVKKKTGSLVRLLLWTGNIDDGTPDYDDFEITYQGLITKIKEDDKIRIDMRDVRVSLDKKTPTRLLDTTDFTDIKSPDKEYLIPQVWGKCFEIPCLSLDENINKGNKTGPWDDYRFMLCDSTLVGYSDDDDFNLDVEIASDAIKAVYIDGAEIDDIPTVQLDSDNGIYYFTLDYEDFYTEDNSGNARFKLQNKVSVDVEGYLDSSSVLIENSMNIVREIIYQSYGYTYDAVFYDLTTWAAFEADAYKCGLYVSKPITIQKQIAEIANSNLGEFVWNANLDFSWNNDDYDGIKAEISKNEFFSQDYIPKVSSDSTEVLAVFRAGTNKKWSISDKEEGFDWIKDDTNETNALTQFNSTRQKDFETLLYDSTDITDYQSRIHFFGDISNDIFSINVPWEYKDLDKGEYIAVEYDRVGSDFIGWVICQIQRIKLNIETWQVELSLRIFEYGPYFSLIANYGYELSAGASTQDYQASDLDSPSISYSMSQPCLFNSPSNICALEVLNFGDWECSLIGIAKSWTPSGSTSGSYVAFYPKGSTWDSFSTLADGLYTIKLPKSANNDELGGNISFYYSKVIYEYVFDGTGDYIRIADDGSVYKNTLSQLSSSLDLDDLVVDANGRVGNQALDLAATDKNIIANVNDENYNVIAYNNPLE